MQTELLRNVLARFGMNETLALSTVVRSGIKRGMSLTFQSNRKLFIGVIHLLPSPGSPRWGGNMEAVLRRAVADARAYERGGADAVVIENFHDVPFTKDAVPPETLAAMAAAGCEIGRASCRERV